MKKLSILLLALLSVISIQAQLDRTSAPKAGVATKLNLGEYTKFELKNGLKVIVVENHKLPVVSYTLSLDIDPIYEGDKAGYIGFAGDLLGTGTTTLSKDQIDEKIDFIGASISTSGNGIYASSLKKHSEETLALMTDILYNPSFPEEELDKMVKQTLTGIKSDKDNPKSISRNVSQALMFGKETAYGEGTSEETIENITIEDCKNYYDTYFRPNVAYLVIIGDITVKEAKKIAKKNFAKWEAKEVPTHAFVEPKSIDKSVYAIAHKDASTQSTISVSYPIDLKPGTPDALKVSVMNSILGGGSFSARLFQNLREDKAWTYGAYSSVSSDEHLGTFKASSNVRGTITDSAFVEIAYEMNRMIDEQVSEETLQLVKNSTAGSFGRALESASTIASFAVNIDKYNLPADYYETYMERLEAITVDDIQAMAAKYLKPDNAVYLAVGDVSVTKPLMVKLANGAEVTEYDYYANKVVRSGVPVGLTAEKVVANHIKSIGGEEILATVNDVAVHATLAVQGMELSMNTYQKAPNKICVETKMGENLLSKQVYNGSVGKMTAQGQEQVLEGKMLETMKYQAILFPELSYTEQGYTLEITGVDKVDGNDAYKVIVTNPIENATTMYFDAKTGLKVKEVSVSEMGSSTTTFGEYKEFEGIKYPTKLTQSMGPQMIDVNITEVIINKGIEDKVFE